MGSTELPIEEQQLLNELQTGLASVQPPKLGSPVLCELADKVLEYGEKEKHFLLRLGSKLQEYNVKLPTVTIEYENLTAKTDATVGSAGITTVGNLPIQVIKACLGDRKEIVELPLLNNLTGVIKPGRLTLLLGPPSCGKTTFLKVLSGHARNSKVLRISGSLRYNGRSPDEFMLQRTASYVAQTDYHIPTLAVNETLSFAETCMVGMHGTDGAGQAAAMEGASRLAQEIQELVSAVWGSSVKSELILRQLGLAHARHTMVGGELIRGISGGETKRLTTSEVLVGPQRVLMLDEISTGLDSATLHSVIQFLAALTHGLQLTTVVSLLQPPPEVFLLFDDLMLMSEGTVVYHGPIGQAKDFFDSMGFVCPERKDLLSYLLELTSPAGQQLYAGPELRQAARRVARPSAAGRAQLLVPYSMMVQHYFDSCPSGQAVKAALAQPFDPAKGHPAALEQRAYALSPLEAVREVTRRQFKLVMRDRVLVRARMGQDVLIGLLTGSLFFNLGHSPQDARSFFGACFMVTLFMLFGAFPQVAIVQEQKRAWFKHRELKMFPAYAQGIAMALSQLPLTLLDATVFGVICYFMMGWYRSAGYFFTFYLLLACASLAVSSLFRTIAVAAPSFTAANASMGGTTLLLITMSGFPIVRGNIGGWWIWCYWLTPISWALRGIMVNEMTSPAWQQPMPFITGQQSVSVGTYSLQSFDIFTERSWIWAGVAYMFGLYLLLTAATIWLLDRVQPPRLRPQVADEQQLRVAKAEAEERRQHLMHGSHDLKDIEATPSAAKAGSQQTGTPAAAAAAAAGEEEDGLSIASNLPVTPITLVFKDLHYYVPNPLYNKSAVKKAQKALAAGDESAAADASVPERLELLKGVSGYAAPGHLTALMGGSGAGKTTLMDVLAGRKTIGSVTGDIYVNGQPKDQRTWSRTLGYVEQFDQHSPMVTVVEALWFSARLRLPAAVSDDQVRAYVDEVMAIIDLMDIMYNLVAGLSVEQRKRLMIGVEMVANPSVIFMDEPTSGLDARAAAIVMRAVRNVGNHGRTVIVTIHQPSIEIFESFDRLLLIHRGGTVAYFGDIGTHSSKLISFLTAVPGVPDVAPGFNPATWMLEVTGGSMATSHKAVDADWSEIYRSSELCKENAAAAERLLAQGAQGKQPALVITSTYAQPFGRQVRELLRKYNLMYYRNAPYNFLRLFITLAASLLYGTLYFRAAALGTTARIADVQNIIGIMFASTNFMGITNMLSTLPITSFERVVFYRERGASMYDPFAYGIAIAVVEVPYLIAQACMFVPITYWMIHFQATAAKFFYYFLMFFSTIAFYSIFGQFLVYVTPTQQVAQVLGGALNFFFNIFNGFVITYPDFPIYWKWMNRAVPTTWILYGLATSQLGDLDTPISFAGREMPLRQFVNERFGFDNGMMWWMLLIVAAYIVFFRVTSILALKYLNFLRR